MNNNFPSMVKVQAMVTRCCSPLETLTSRSERKLLIKCTN